MWFIDVELRNPDSGEVVRKRLDFRVEPALPKSSVALAAKEFESALAAMIQTAEQMTKKK